MHYSNTDATIFQPSKIDAKNSSQSSKKQIQKKHYNVWQIKKYIFYKEKYISQQIFLPCICA